MLTHSRIRPPSYAGTVKWPLVLISWFKETEIKAIKDIQNDNYSKITDLPILCSTCCKAEIIICSHINYEYAANDGNR